MGDLHALSVSSACMQLGPDDCMVRPTPRHGSTPEVLSTPFCGTSAALALCSLVRDGQLWSWRTSVLQSLKLPIPNLGVSNRSSTQTKGTASTPLLCLLLHVSSLLYQLCSSWDQHSFHTAGFYTLPIRNVKSQTQRNRGSQRGGNETLHKLPCGKLPQSLNDSHSVERF